MQKLKENSDTIKVYICMPSWVCKRIKALAALQQTTGQDWICSAICKALKTELKADKVKWHEIYESATYDLSYEELQEILLNLYKLAVLKGVKYKDED